MIESNLLNLQSLENPILDRFNQNSNFFEVNNTINGQLNNGCGCPIKPVYPLNPIQSSVVNFESSESYLFYNERIINSFDKSENTFLLESSDPLIGDSQGINVNSINFKENNSITDREINSEVSDLSGNIGEEETLIQSESFLQVRQPIGIFNPQGQLIAIEQNGIRVIEIDYDFAGNISRLTDPNSNYGMNVFLDPVSNLLTLNDSAGNTVQGFVDPITGNTSQVTVNLTNLPPIPGADCFGLGILLILAVKTAISSCREFGFVSAVCKENLVLAGVALTEFYNNCITQIPFSNKVM